MFCKLFFFHKFLCTIILLFLYSYYSIYFTFIFISSQKSSVVSEMAEVDNRMLEEQDKVLYLNTLFYFILLYSVTLAFILTMNTLLKSFFTD